MRMRVVGVLAVALALGLLGEGAWAASYQKIDGTIVDPIPCWDDTAAFHGWWGTCDGSHTYSGSDLVPGANLMGARLLGANLSRADLRSANLDDAMLQGANLADSDLSDADLTNARMFGALYTAGTIFPLGFDVGSTGMVEGIVINNGLAPPNPENEIEGDSASLAFFINNAGCNALFEHPCASPGAPTSVSGSVHDASIYESSEFSGLVRNQVLLRDSSSFSGTAWGIILHDSSTADAILSCDFGCFLLARDDSSATVQAQAYEAGVHSSGNAFVHAGGGAWENVSASGNSHLIVTGGEAQGSNFSVSDNALLEIYVDEPWGIYVNGGRAVLHRGSSHVGTLVERGGVLEVSGGWLESDRSDQPVSVTGNRISGRMFMSSGGIGPGDFRVDGYAEIYDGIIVAAATPEYSVPGPWNFSAYGEGLIELLGGAMNEFVSIGARDDSRIRIFGNDFSVSGQLLPYGMVVAPTGTISGTLANGDPINNPFAHRGADCGGQPCTGRILVLAPGLDWDQDAIPNPFDNCAEEPNADQADVDADGTGDVCFAAVDLDRDAIIDALDNCRVDANADQADADFDGVGDACEKNLIFWADKGLEGCTTPPKRLPYEMVSNDLGNGDVINRSAQPCDCFGIEYPVTPGTASVRFLHRTESGFVEEYCENVAPYALGLGPNQPICADGLDEDGLHEVMVTPYDAPGCEAGGGNALPSSIRSFTMAAPEPGLGVMVGAGVLAASTLSRRRIALASQPTASNA
jgi:hypothetical protein